MQEILKQPQYEPMSVENMVMLIFAGTNGYADRVPVDQMKRWEAELLRTLASSYGEIGADIAANKRITEETEKKLRDALALFQTTWQ
jgi:F-type H+-transporting ATPase subunit alpha